MVEGLSPSFCKGIPPPFVACSGGTEGVQVDLWGFGGEVCPKGERGDGRVPGGQSFLVLLRVTDAD